MDSNAAELTPLPELLSCPFCGEAGIIEHSYHEDEDRHPRDFWHVRAVCSVCVVSPTGWVPYGNQEQRVANFHVKRAAEASAIATWNHRVSGYSRAVIEQITKELSYAFASDTMGDHINVWWASVGDKERAKRIASVEAALAQKDTDTAKGGE